MCHAWPACGCGTQSGPHTCEFPQHDSHLQTYYAELRKWRREYRRLKGLSDDEFDRRYGDLNA